MVKKILRIVVNMRIISHRGFSKNCPENSIESFKAALTSGVNILETDVCMCKCNTLIVSHENIDPVSGIPVGETYRTDQLELKSFLESFAHLNIEFIFDVKEFSRETKIIKKLMEILYTFGACEKSTIASFNEVHIQYARDYRLPGIKVALISERIESDFFKKIITIYDLDFLIISVLHVTPELVKSVDIPVLTYTCNTKGLFEYCKKSGVYGVITDSAFSSL